MNQRDLIANTRIDRWLELLVIWLLSASVLGLVAALSGHFMAIQVCLASLLVTGAYNWYTASRSTMLGRPPDWRHLALLTLLCLFFRLPAYHYVLGGQDEGVYVNMAHHIVRTGGIEVRDTALDRINDPSLAVKYVKENHPADYLPGIYLLDHAGAGLQFQFYHLFPVWMAIFAGLFGPAWGIYALTFFSWLSIVFIYRLALAISGSPRAALIVGGLLAVNPLHVYFSKFPVTEVPSLAFSLVGFTFLVLGRNEKGRIFQSRWLSLSAAAFGCLFVTRISGFMYMPFVIAAATASAIGDSDRQLQRAMFWWCAVVTTLYALSVAYGLHWSGEYSRDIYHLSFARAFGKWEAGASTTAVVALGVWLTAALAASAGRARKQMGRYLLAPARRAIVAVVILGVIAGLFKIYRLGWTNHFLHDRRLGEQWHLSGSTWIAVEASSLFQLLVYMGPLLLAGVLMLIRRKSDPRVEFLRLFAAGFLVYVCLLQWTVPYGPYYARYLLSENVPYLMLLVVLVWASMTIGWRRTATSWLLGISLLYMAAASTGQLGKSENAGLYGSLKRILTPVGPGDLVLMTSLGPEWPGVSQIKTPFLYTFGREVINVSDSSLDDRAYIAALDDRFGAVFLLSTSSAPPQGFELVNSERLRVWSFSRSFLFPHELTLNAEKRLYLYRLTSSVLPLGHMQSFNVTGSRNAWLTKGWSTPERWGTWSLGNHAELAVNPVELPTTPGGVRLHFEANAMVTSGHPHQRIDLTVNGVPVGQQEVTFPQSTLGFDVEVPESALGGTGKLIIGFDLPDAASPQAIGIGGDGRLLALGLKSVTAIPLNSPLPTLGSPSKSKMGGNSVL